MRKKYWIIGGVILFLLIMLFGIWFFFFREVSSKNKKFLEPILEKEVRNFHTDIEFQLSSNPKWKQTLDADFNVINRGGTDYINACGHYAIGFNEDKTEIQFFEIASDTITVTSLDDMDISKSDISKIYSLFLEIMKNDNSYYRDHKVFVDLSSSQQEQLSLYLNMLSCESVVDFDPSPWSCVFDIQEDSIRSIECNNSKYNTFSATISGYNETKLFKIPEEE